MIVTVPKANPKSMDGGLLLDGLLVDARGNTEPVFIIRASEPAAADALLAYLDSSRRHRYAGQFVDATQRVLAKFTLWRKDQAIIAREDDQWVIEKDAVPVKTGKK